MTSEKPANEDFAALLAEYDSSPTTARKAGPKRGDIVSGAVVSIGADSVFIDVGGKCEGALARDELTNSDGQLVVALGDLVEARVVQTGDNLVLRRTVGKGPDARNDLMQAQELEIPVEGVVTGTNKGGFEVQVAGVRAFCPISQMDTRYIDTPEVFVGQRLHFRITRYEAGTSGRDNIVLSRRALLEQEFAARAVETREKLKLEAVFSGKVTAIENYGAFVDIGGIEGFLHISELGFTRVDKATDVLSIGQELQVQVIKIETTNNPKRPEKIGLSLKSLQRDPWRAAASNIAAGSRVTGTVVRIEPFGAFVEVADGVEGLIHISEMGAGKRIHTPKKVVSIGDQVEATVLSVDLERHRLALSMDAAVREQEVAQEQANISAHTAPTKSMGTFADLFGKLGKQK